MEILTADRRKQLRLLGEIDGLRRARVIVYKADYMSLPALNACDELFSKEIDALYLEVDEIEARSKRKSDD